MRKNSGGMSSDQKWIRITALLLALVLTGCSAPAQNVPSDPTDPTASVPTEPVETEPPPTAPADGNPADVTCQGSYTVTDEEAAAAADTVVATVGETQLTNSQLQILYWLEVAQYRAENGSAVPDLSRGLDTQMCGLADGAITWQQYLLDRALNSWHSLQALNFYGLETPLELEEAYNPDPKQHEEYLSDTLPALKYLYGYYNDYFEPNSMHQAYLDSLPDLLERIAGERGYGSASELVADVAGAGTDAEELTALAALLNWDYMYYTQLTYDMDVTAGEVESYYSDHAGEYADAGITGDSGYTVNLRHILLVPEEAQVAADGTVTASEESWEACLMNAQEVLEQWGKTVRNLNYKRLENAAEAEFGELANTYSADAGSAHNGGLYSAISRGQLIEELDSWCFDGARQYGDTAIIRTAYGYHIVYFAGSQEIWYARAEKDLLGEMAEELMSGAVEAYPMTVDYSAIALGLAEQSGQGLTWDDLLYPDVAHERFPEAPLYLQRDYQGTMYGSYPVYTYGCGITTMAMLASYMTDDEWTVPELCALYGKYCFKTGTDYSLYDDAPCELGFYGIRRSNSWDEVAQCLESGNVAISIQRGPGYWTRRGHYILLQNFTEDGMVVVRDSNILNYQSIANHQIDAHTVSSITARNVLYWVLEEKVTRIGACWRCDDTGHEGACMGIFLEDYTCEKCAVAQTRRNNFTAALEAMK